MPRPPNCPKRTVACCLCSFLELPPAVVSNRVHSDFQVRADRLPTKRKHSISYSRVGAVPVSPGHAYFGIQIIVSDRQSNSNEDGGKVEDKHGSFALTLGVWWVEGRPWARWCVGDILGVPSSHSNRTKATVIWRLVWFNSFAAGNTRFTFQRVSGTGWPVWHCNTSILHLLLLALAPTTVSMYKFAPQTTFSYQAWSKSDSSQLYVRQCIQGPFIDSLGEKAPK